MSVTTDSRARLRARPGIRGPLDAEDMRKSLLTGSPPTTYSYIHSLTSQACSRLLPWAKIMLGGPCGTNLRPRPWPQDVACGEEMGSKELLEALSLFIAPKTRAETPSRGTLLALRGWPECLSQGTTRRAGGITLETTSVCGRAGSPVAPGSCFLPWSPGCCHVSFLNL